MSDHDPLKALLQETAPPAPPSYDLGFALEVMKRVEKRRLIDGLLALSAFVATLSAILFAVMPYLTPVVNDFGRLLAPALGVMVLIGLSLLALEPVRRMLRI
ncbi:MAG TPA: hypothetical protein VN042_03445 [Asticcacaulis sp.]|nr:hypothetical protein [Asticcacaulis sp.]